MICQNNFLANIVETENSVVSFGNLHGMVEELLELFVDKIDADLLECIKFEDLKSWDKH